MAHLIFIIFHHYLPWYSLNTNWWCEPHIGNTRIWKHCHGGCFTMRRWNVDEKERCVYESEPERWMSETLWLAHFSFSNFDFAGENNQIEIEIEIPTEILQKPKINSLLTSSLPSIGIDWKVFWWSIEKTITSEAAQTFKIQINSKQMFAGGWWVGVG